MKFKLRVFTFGLATAALFAAPAGAHAAIVNNGDFETGDLSGWQRSDSEAGSWFAYTGTVVGGDPVPAPPQGTHAAITDQGGESRQILYQDISLPPGGSVNQLSLIAYYTAYAPIVSPDSLDFGAVFSNEQYRIDVMRPSAPIDSVAAGDILTTVFRTVSGDPQVLGPTQRTVDLSAIAGQTVRLRLAVVVTDQVMNAGADAISVRSNGFTVGKTTLNKKKGTASLPVTVPDDGTLKVSGKGVSDKATLASKAVAVSGGTVKLLVKPNKKTKRKLNDSGRAKVKVSITYKPKGLTGNTEKTKIKLKKKS